MAEAVLEKTCVLRRTNRAWILGYSRQNVPLVLLGSNEKTAPKE